MGLIPGQHNCQRFSLSAPFVHDSSFPIACSAGMAILSSDRVWLLGMPRQPHTGACQATYFIPARQLVHGGAWGDGFTAETGAVQQRGPCFDKQSGRDGIVHPLRSSFVIQMGHNPSGEAVDLRLVALYWLGRRPPAQLGTVSLSVPLPTISRPRGLVGPWWPTETARDMGS